MGLDELHETEPYVPRIEVVPGQQLRRAAGLSRAFEKAGVLFITDDEIAGISVRLKKKR
jgi:hypothetical protein